MERELRSGERLVVKVVEPPLGKYVDEVGCWADLKDDLLSGRLAEWLVAPYYVGEIAGEVVGSMACYTGVDGPELGLVEFVQTAEAHRRKGIAGVLMEALVADFVAGGGKALFLCTVNPHAGDLYEKNGFWYLVGDGMRYLAPGAEHFAEQYLSHQGEARVRAATWADLPAGAALFNQAEVDWWIKEYIAGVFGDTRYERHFVELMRRTEDGRGAVLVLENPLGRMVGLAAFVRGGGFYEQHVGYVSCFVCPAYWEQVPEFLAAVGERAGAMSIGVLQTYVADGDEAAIDMWRRGGFAAEARLRGRLRDGKQTRDLLVFATEIAGAQQQRKPRDDFYGQRNAWQAQRVARTTSR